MNKLYLFIYTYISVPVPIRYPYYIRQHYRYKPFVRTRACVAARLRAMRVSEGVRLSEAHFHLAYISMSTTRVCTSTRHLDRCAVCSVIVSGQNAARSRLYGGGSARGFQKYTGKFLRGLRSLKKKNVRQALYSCVFYKDVRPKLVKYIGTCSGMKWSTYNLIVINPAAYEGAARGDHSHFPERDIARVSSSWEGSRTWIFVPRKQLDLDDSRTPLIEWSISLTSSRYTLHIGNFYPMMSDFCSSAGNFEMEGGL